EFPRGARIKEKTGGSPAGYQHAGRSINLATVHIGAGQAAGIRPGDLVGAIANEAGLKSQLIGPITIGDHFSLVKVPEELAQGVIKALSRTRIKGKKVAVRLHR